MEIKTNIKLNNKLVESLQTGNHLAKEIKLFADDNSSAVSKKEFQNKLSRMEKLSTQNLIKFIRSFDNDESVIELIVDEVGSSKDERKNTCKKVLNALVNKAKELGIDTFDFENQFNTELNIQFRKIGFVNTEKLDSIINALTQMIENRQNFTAEDIQAVQNTPTAEGQEQANGVIEKRLEKAYAAFGERVGEDGEMTDVKEYVVNLKTGEKTEVKYNGQMQRDGIAADIADGVKKIFGSENTAAKVRKDLKTTNTQLQQLKEAKTQGEEVYKAKFKEIFGVEYDYANMVAYQKAEAAYINASSNYEFEMMFNRTLKTLLSLAPLREEVRYDNPDAMTNMVITTVTATKEQVYSREFNNLAEFLTQKDSNGNGIKGSEILNKAFEEKGVANGTIEEKFEVLKQIAKTLSKELHTATLEAGSGKEFSEVQAMYDNSYKAAYGIENDIMKRVTDYNVSQEIGAGVVKAGTTIAASLIAAFTGCGLVGVAAWTTGATVGAEVIDRGSSGKALNVLREQGLGEYLETTFKDVDWEATLKQAAMSGAAVLIGGGVAQGVSAIMKGSSSVAQFAAMLGSDVITDATMEFFMTKQITWEGIVFTVLLSTIGNAAQLKQMKNAAATNTAKSVGNETSLKQVKNLGENDIIPVLPNARFTSYKFHNSKLMDDFTPLLNETILQKGISTKNGIGDCFIKGLSDTPLGTSGVGNCAVLCLQNTEKGTSALYHAAPIKQNAIANMQKDIDIIMPEGFDKVFIIPGRNPETATTSINLLKAASKINKNAEVVFKHSGNGDNVQIIFYNGNVYSLPYVKTPAFRVCENPENYYIGMIKK